MSAWMICLVCGELHKVAVDEADLEGGEISPDPCDACAESALVDPLHDEREDSE